MSIRPQSISRAPRLPIQALVAALALPACVQDDDSRRNTVEYFERHETARREQMALCQNDPGRLWYTRDCVNARHADAKKALGNLRDLPPVGLVEKDPRLNTSEQQPSSNVRR